MCTIKEYNVGLSISDLVEEEIYVARFPENPNWDSLFKSRGGLQLYERLYLNSNFKPSNRGI